jgi:hypothetical protein
MKGRLAQFFSSRHSGGFKAGIFLRVFLLEQIHERALLNYDDLKQRQI